jgi:hypothetical protein
MSLRLLISNDAAFFSMIQRCTFLFLHELTLAGGGESYPAMNLPSFTPEPRETMCGWMHLPRYIDKIRLHLAGKLHADYQPNLGKDSTVHGSRQRVWRTSSSWKLSETQSPMGKSRIGF